MAYTPDVFNVGDIVRAAWANKVEQQLAKQGNYMGVVASESDLPTEASLGDWYFVQDKGYIVYYDGSNWKRQKVEWDEVLNKPIKFVNSFSDLPTSPSEGEAYYIYNADTVVTYRNGAWQLPQTGEYIPRGAIAYFTTSLIDKVNYITPEGFENSTVTDYGLYTTSDGSLVVTKRYDDKPFDGVHVFAVEEGTTNLVEGYGGTGYIGVANINKPASYSSSSQPVYKYGASAAYGKTFAVSITDTVVADGESLSVSGWIKYVDGDNDYPNLYIKLSSGNAIYVDTLTQVPKDGKWHYFTKTWTNDTGSDVTVTWVWADVIGSTAREYESYAFQIQVEKKPFATSFVDGSRVDGIVQIPNTGFDFNNFVVSAWFKIFKINNPYPRIFDMRNGISGWLLNWSSDSSKFAFGYGINSQTNVYFDTISAGDVENKWWFVVLVFVDGVIKGYLYNESNYFSKVEHDITLPDLSTVPLRLGNDSVKDRALNGLISNLYIGKAKDSSGNLIWTDDYVKKIYMLQRPWIIGG